MLVFLDYLLTFVHFGIVSFNLFGWIPPITRKAHFISIILTAASWFILGIWFGIGYCPVTDWQWEVKEKLGERNLPASFITYYSEKLTGLEFSPAFINAVTLAGFILAVMATIYVNIIKKRKA
jgi:hypothetical protein